jgi:TfoX/Sxy family transcriptional regulator of competence genes
MAYDEGLAERVREFFDRRGVGFEEKKMMGGLAFMVNDKMCVGIMKQELMVRVDPARHGELAAKPNARAMELTGRRMNGFLQVEPDGLSEDSELEQWIDLAMEYNPRARSSKRR